MRQTLRITVGCIKVGRAVHCPPPGSGRDEPLARPPQRPSWQLGPATQNAPRPEHCGAPGPKGQDWRASPATFKGVFLILLFTALLAGGSSARAQEWLDRVDDSLFYQSPNGWLRSDLSGLLDLEFYYNDQTPPGLVIANDETFFNPRLSLFVDTKLGKRFYSLVQVRFDRGFDPGTRRDGDIRADEYLLRYKPFDEPWLHIQAGKFATVFGDWVNRHDTWNNPFIYAPLPYENVTIITDRAAPGGPAGFLGRRAIPDNKPAWLPMIWGPAYTSGASVFGAVEKFDYAFEFKNASISSRPAAWDVTRIDWDAPTWSGRVGWRPNASWKVGSSFSHGAYLLPPAVATLPAGTGLNDFKQTTVGTDVTWAWRHWQVWAEAIATRFAVPNVGDAESIAYFIEAKYKFTPKLFGAARWNQQFFNEVPDGTGGTQAWDRDAWRAELGAGYRFTRHVQAKIHYGYNHQKGPRQQGEQMLAGQLTLKF
jgi:hypothetical protein